MKPPMLALTVGGIVAVVLLLPGCETRAQKGALVGGAIGGGHYENRIVRTPSGEGYEERVWVPAR